MTGPSAARTPVAQLSDARRRRADRARQVADVLRHQVLAGAFRDGAAAQRGRSSCREFDASRNTVREALGLLARRGAGRAAARIGTTVVTEQVRATACTG